MAGIRALRSNVSATGENTVETKKEDEDMREGETNKGVNYTVGTVVKQLGEWGINVGIVDVVK